MDDTMTPQPEHENLVVGYTVKELLFNIDEKLNKLTKLVEQKADKKDFDALESRVSALEKDGAIQEALHKLARQDYRLRVVIVGLIISALGVVFNFAHVIK